MRLGRWGRAWLQFLGFFVLALFVWFAIESEQSGVVQRALEVPLAVTGLGVDRVPIGVPDSVIVIVSGLSTTVERLRPESFDAFIDLREVTGDFDVAVRVIAPQGIEVTEVTPARVIGGTEALDSRLVPLRLSLLGAQAATDGLRLRVQPSEVIVSGQETRIARVSFVTAVLDTVSETEPTTVTGLFAVDAGGLPVQGVRITPAEAAVVGGREPLLYSRRLPVDPVFITPEPFTTRDVSLSGSDLLIAGPREAIVPLERVEVRAEVPAETGAYRLELEPVLPDGVAALEELSADLVVVDPRDAVSPAEAGPVQDDLVQNDPAQSDPPQSAPGGNGPGTPDPGATSP